MLAALAGLTWGIARQLTPEEVATRAFTIVGDDARVDPLTVAASVTFEDAWPRRVVRRPY